MGCGRGRVLLRFDKRLINISITSCHSFDSAFY